jgi:prepilin-type N-terminal cleavage/methylation domain-containing protein
MFNGKKGYTLVEVIVTLLILSLLLAITVPTFRDYFSFLNLRKFSNFLYQDLKLAQENAKKFGINPIYAAAEEADGAPAAEVKVAYQSFTTSGLISQHQCGGLLINYSGFYRHQDITAGTHIDITIDGVPAFNVVFKANGTPVAPGQVSLSNGKKTYRILVGKAGHISLTEE